LHQSGIHGERTDWLRQNPLVVASLTSPLIRRSLVRGVFRVAGNEKFSKRSAGVLLSHHASEEQHGTARAVVHHEVLGFSGRVAFNGYDYAGGLTLNLTGVLLEEAVVAVVAS
jgi:hypothetical protein